MTKIISFIGLLLFTIQSQLWAFEIVPFKPNVVDEANIFTALEIESINNVIATLQNESGIFAAVYMVRSLDGMSIEEAAEKTFKKWELGDAKNDNGLLILISIKDRKTRIEVGYGLEGDVTDLKSKRIIDEQLIPAFRREQYKEGIIAALDELSFIKTGHLPPQGISRYLTPDFIKRTYLWLLGFWGMPFIISLIGLVWAKKKNTETIQKMRELKRDNLYLQTLGARTKSGFVLKLVFTFIPGIFITLLPVIFRSNDMTFFMNSIAGMFVIVSTWKALTFVRRMHSFNFYMEVELMLLHQKQRDENRGSGFMSYLSTSSSSSEYGGGSSYGGGGGGGGGFSSSGGGSSGGGGASGGW